MFLCGKLMIVCTSSTCRRLTFFSQPGSIEFLLVSCLFSVVAWQVSGYFFSWAADGKPSLDEIAAFVWGFSPNIYPLS